MTRLIVSTQPALAFCARELHLKNSTGWLRKKLHLEPPSLRSAFLYGENVLDKSQQPQARDREKIRGPACRAEGEERLPRPLAASTRCQSYPGRKPVRGDWPPPCVHSPV